MLDPERARPANLHLPWDCRIGDVGWAIERHGAEREISMALTLYAHPFAAYCWKVLVALYENPVAFTYRIVEDASNWAELESLWPIKKFPVIRDRDAVVIESSIIVEYLTLHYPGPSRLLPAKSNAALETRFMDRVFDNYVMTPMQKLVADRMHAARERDLKGVADAPIGDSYPTVRDYRSRLLARPSVARTVDEARPYRKLFPAGAPDRD